MDEIGGAEDKRFIKTFEFDEEPEEKRDGKQYSKPVFNKETNKWIQYYSPAGELFAKCIEAAGEYFNMYLPFPGQYMVGLTYSDTH